MKRNLFVIVASAMLLLASCGGSSSSSASSASVASSEATSASSQSSSSAASSSAASSSAASSSASSIWSSAEETIGTSVEPIKGIKDDFFFGMDCSSVIALEQSGVKYYDFSGRERDLFDILAEYGVNLVRVRIWNDPYDSEGHGYGGGNNDVAKAVEIGKRVTKYGMKLHVDFHYSDFWADPKKQQAPKAWSTYTLDQKKTALYDFTLDAMTQLKEAEVDVGMVQVGNETNNFYMCGEKNENTIALMAEGSKAVRETYPDALVAVHFTNPEKAGRLDGYANTLKNAGLDYDVLGTSYYPYWHGSLSNLSSVLSGVANKYDKKVMVMETSYANTLTDTDFHGNTISSKGSGYPYDTYPISQQGQANFLHDLTETLVNTDSCLGLSYWEGTWISVNKSSWAANSALWEQYGSGWASSYCAEYDPEDGGKWYGGSAVDNQCFFDRYGKALHSLRTFNQLKAESVTPITSSEASEESSVVSSEADTSLLPNGGFEDADSTAWTMVKNSEDLEYLVITPYDYAYEGANALNFYSSKAGGVDFYIEQEITGLAAGNYTFSMYVMGGDTTDYECASYVKIGDAEALENAGSITSWQEWHQMKVDFEYDGTSTLVVGTRVKCAEGGAWGYLDAGSIAAR